MTEKEISKVIASFDQNSTMITKTFPMHWFAMYKSLQESGFTKDEAMHLLSMYVEMQLVDLMNTPNSNNEEECNA